MAEYDIALDINNLNTEAGARAAAARTRRSNRLGAAANVAGRIGTAVAGDNTTGHVATAIAMIPHPAAQAAAAVLGVISHFEAKSDAREAKRQRTASVIKNARVVDDPNIYICYGACATSGNRAYVALGDDFPVATPNDRGNASRGARRVFGEFIFEDDAPTHNGQPNEFLLQQIIVSAGDIQALENVRINDSQVEPYGFEARQGGNAIGISKVALRTGASPLATAFAPRERSASSKYSGLTYADVIAQMPYNENDLNKRNLWRQRGAFPDVVLFVRGRTTAIIEAAKLGSSEWSDNAIRAVIDYITSVDYGPGLDADTFIDYASVKAVQDAAHNVWLGADSDIWTRNVGASLEGIMAQPAARTYSSALLLAGYSGVGDTGQFPFAQSDSQADPAGKPLRRGAFNGRISCAMEFYDAIDELAATTPGLILYWGRSGKIKASLPDPWADRETAHVAEIDESMRPEGSALGVVEPDADNRTTSVLITYNSRNHGFKPQTYLWPEAGSDEATALLALNGGRERQLEIRLDGVSTRFHAACIAKALCSYSNRRRISDTVFWGIDGKDIEPGDIVRFTDPGFSAVSYVGRVDRVDVDFSTYTAEISATEHYPSDYAPPVPKREAYQGDYKPANIADSLPPIRVVPNNINLAPGASIDIEAMLSPSVAASGTLLNARWEWSAVDLETTITGATDTATSSMRTITAAQTATDRDVAITVEYTANINPVIQGVVSETRRITQSVVFSVAIRAVASSDTGDPLEVDVVSQGGGVFQAQPKGGDGTASTWAWATDPAGGAAAPVGGDSALVRVTGASPAALVVATATQSGVDARGASLVAYGDAAVAIDRQAQAQGLL